MTEYLHDRVFDYGLNELDTNVTKLTITRNNTAPGLNYTLANSTPGAGGYRLGIKTQAPGSIYNRTAGGRAINMAAITNGTISVTGTAKYWCWLDGVNLRMLAYGLLSAEQAVTAGNTFTLTEHSVGIPDPA